MNIITLTTDFGTADWFVGSMNGVILGINPQAAVVDVTHEIPSGDIRAAAFALLVCYRCFPQDTIHVAVVDPGVGSSRAAIAKRMQASTATRAVQAIAVPSMPRISISQYTAAR